MRTLAEKIERGVQKGPPSECWPWTRAHLPSGYGKLRHDKKYLLAHRVVWELQNGPIPNGLQVCHSCDNPPCCNPEHLWLGTPKANTVDMIAKGRLRLGYRPFGMNHHRAKATTEQVEMIRALPPGTNLNAIAREIGMSGPGVRAIWRGEVRSRG
jgi:hypothetical protein